MGHEVPITQWRQWLKLIMDECEWAICAAIDDVGYSSLLPLSIDPILQLKWSNSIVGLEPHAFLDNGLKLLFVKMASKLILISFFSANLIMSLWYWGDYWRDFGFGSSMNKEILG